LKAYPLNISTCPIQVFSRQSARQRYTYTYSDLIVVHAPCVRADLQPSTSDMHKDLSPEDLAPWKLLS